MTAKRIMKRLFKNPKEKKPLLNKDQKQSTKDHLPTVMEGNKKTYNAVASNANANTDGSEDNIRRSILERFGDDYSKATLISASNSEHDFESFEGYAKSGSALTFAAVAFLIYFVVGAIAFHVLFEDWTVIDSAYMASVTFTTCGYGDLTPTEDGTFELTFMILYVGVGVLVLATLAFNLVFQNIFDGYDAIVQQNKKQHEDDFLKGMTREKKKSSLSLLEEGRKSNMMLADMGNVMISVAPLFIILILGTMLIGKVEGWDVMKSMYFLVVTATTVGYGDVSPQTQSMRFLCIFFIPFAVGIMAETFGRLAGVYLAVKGEEKQREFFSRNLTFADIKRMDKDGDKEVSKVEFIQFILIALGKISEEDWEQVDDLFEKLDVNGDGSLSYDDVLAMIGKGKARVSRKKRAQAVV